MIESKSAPSSLNRKLQVQCQYLTSKNLSSSGYIWCSIPGLRFDGAPFQIFHKLNAVAILPLEANCT